MQESKGQGIIVEILAFAMSMMLAMLVFIVMISTGGVTEHNASEAVGYKIGELRMRSVVSNTMNDRLWRESDISRGEYSNWPAHKVISKYFSTEGDRVYIYEDYKQKSTVKSDIESYLEFKMEKYWQGRPNKINYSINISDQRTPDGPDKLSVEDYNPDASGARITYPIGLTNGSTAEATLWIDEGTSIYSVGG